MVSKVVVSIHVMQFGKVLCFAFSDGTVQYRDRFTMNEIYHEQDMNRIMNPLQVGFQYEPETPCEFQFSCSMPPPPTNVMSRSRGGLFADELLVCPNQRGLDSEMEQDAVPSRKHEHAARKYDHLRSNPSPFFPLTSPRRVQRCFRSPQHLHIAGILLPNQLR